MKKTKWIILCFIAFVCLTGPFTVSANTMRMIDADDQFNLANAYYQDQEFELAIIEFNRFVYFFPQDMRLEQARYHIGLSYFNTRQYKKAVKHFSNLINFHEDSTLAVESYFMISRCYVQLNLMGQAVSTLQNIATLSTDTNVKDRAYYTMGWIEIDQLNLRQAKIYFNKISELNRKTYQIPELSTAIGKDAGIPRKNPTVAGALSILPGAGQLYCHRYKDALLAFIINGGLIWATVEAFDKENYALGSVIGFVELGFYTGNIYSAKSAAHKYNRDQTQRFIDDLKQNLSVSLTPTSGLDGVYLGFQYRF
ncbi:MAG: tetratricopeptide repeat protein [Desulfobacteraceae bacterium]|nr:tetratricopeptide repeat protein [Desulfobacteraceae bacterium]